MTRVIVAFLVCLFLATSAWAVCGTPCSKDGDTYTCTGASLTLDCVQDAVNAASDGDKIACGAGTLVLGSNTLSINTGGALQLYSPGANTTITGAGSTTIYNIVVHPTANKATEIGPGFTIGSYGGNNYIEILYGGSGDACATSYCANVINVHGNTFYGTGGLDGPGIVVRNRVSGVIWNNYWYGPDNYRPLLSQPEYYSKMGNLEYAEDTELGGSDYVFFEGNTLDFAIPAFDITDGASFSDADAGAKLVIRYNSSTNALLGHHDARTGNPPYGLRGTRAYEYYNNDLHITRQNGFFGNPAGGAGVIHDNIFRGYASQILSIYNSRLTAAYGVGNPWLTYCDADTSEKICTAGNPPMACTQDSDCGAGGKCAATDTTIGGRAYPLCRDQTGAGKQDANGAQASEPLYAWGNYKCQNQTFYNLGTVNGTNANGCTITTTSGNFSAATHLGKTIYIATTNGWLPNDYTIESVNSTTSLTLDAACATVDSRSGSNPSERGYAWIDNYSTLESCLEAGAGRVALVYTDLVRADSRNHITTSDVVVQASAPGGYTPYTCPHPLTNLAGSCTASLYGVAGYPTEGTPPAPPAGVLTLGGSGTMTPGTGGTITLSP